ncbi:branched-chain amino acid ABC transporter permease [Bordetella bronchiseptica]|uniref:branched-chain amino acid ABC transporter permease n=1 Tax=Bordetella bronchiseptica TaxID=518 RepID=UPI00028FABDC|nr:branched-chain amino acid ABC transporter permease [Bordetella bronchiseptica]AWP86702.1 branched-chain amino acid ABC transporter permease [Bordetella bronchiseptica]AWQ12273.1 branched-chain amino acid ABC transporter permease [Bordetella bronchiseptica]AXT87386.1 branched-chain amino acid ABC transporter permease [Bordetella bronchiseptica]KAB1450596.1 branched-chain amino acid ABC transporter permease [Bordetella bronchiseptica]KAB1576082.1 branched-chain amino acid ABC transporter perm
MDHFLQQLIYGLSVGSTYAMIALAITLVFRGMDIINFAQGEIFMVGAFLGYVFHVDLGLSMWLAFPLAIASALVFGSFLERVFMRRLENSNQLSLFMMTVALFILLRSAAQLLFGSSAYRFPPLSEHAASIGSVRISDQYLIVIGMTLLIMLLLYLLFTRTPLGLSVRAVAQDKTTARMMGINVSRINNFTVALCSALGAAAGIVYAPIAVLSFDMGNLIMLKGFTAALLGGLGLLSGAVLGGIMLGVIEQFGTLLINSAYKDLVSFSILLLIILVKPNGILGKKQIKKV